MEHLHQAEDPSALDPEAALAALGITDGLDASEPPEWVRKAITPDQRRAWAQLVLHVATNGMGHPSVHALVILKLAMQPGLPAQAGGFLAFVAAEFMAAQLLEEKAAGRACINSASVLGLIDKATHDLSQSFTDDEDLDQDAGSPLGVGA